MRSQTKRSAVVPPLRSERVFDLGRRCLVVQAENIFSITLVGRGCTLTGGLGNRTLPQLLIVTDVLCGERIKHLPSLCIKAFVCVYLFWVTPFVFFHTHRSRPLCVPSPPHPTSSLPLLPGSVPRVPKVRSSLLSILSHQRFALLSLERARLWFCCASLTVWRCAFLNPSLPGSFDFISQSFFTHTVTCVKNCVFCLISLITKL